MATITSAGLGSGLDVNSIVTQMVALERQPINQLQTEATTLQTKVSSYGKLQSAISGLRDAAAKLTDPATWNATAATSSDTNAVSVTSDAKAQAGSYGVEVQSLASSQSTVSAVYSGGGAVIGLGTLHIEVGSWNASQTAFSMNPDWPKADITIGPGDDTLEKIRDKINASGAAVVASVVTDATGSRLVLRSTSTGAENGFRVTATDADGNNADAAGLSALAFDPSSSISNMSQTQVASDAKVKVNGLELVSPSNTFANVVEGMTFKVGKVTTSPVDVTVNQDVESMKKTVTDFAASYTALNNLIKDQTKYDAANKASSPLQGDQTVNGILSGMRNILTQVSGASSVYSMLSDVGLSVDAKGAMTVNSTKLSSALSGNQADVKKLFSNLDSATPANDGFGQRFKSFTDKLLSFEGAITTRTEGLQKRISNNSKQQQTLEDRVESFRKRLLAQYNALDLTMSKLNGTSNYVTQQLNQMSSQSS
jgi:flagellar hook-associated protein 2